MPQHKAWKESEEICKKEEAGKRGEMVMTEWHCKTCNYSYKDKLDVRRCSLYDDAMTDDDNTCNIGMDLSTYIPPVDSLKISRSRRTGM